MTTDILLDKLSNLNINIIKDGKNTYREVSQDSEYYHVLTLQKQTWCFCLFQRGNLEIKKTFDCYDHAMRYFCIIEVRSHMFQTYLTPAYNKYKILYSTYVTENDILNLFKQLHITNPMDSYRVCIESSPVTNNYRVRIYYKDSLIHQTIDIEYSDACFVLFRYAYSIHLLFTMYRDITEIVCIEPSDLVTFLLSN